MGKERMQPGRYEARRMNPKAKKMLLSPDVGWRNLVGQWPVSNSSVRKPPLLIYKCGV